VEDFIAALSIKLDVFGDVLRTKRGTVKTETMRNTHANKSETISKCSTRIWTSNDPKEHVP